MKKVFPCILIILMLFSGCGSSYLPFEESTTESVNDNGYIFQAETSDAYAMLSCDNNYDSNDADNSITASDALPQANQQSPSGVTEGEFRGVWLSYYEIDVDSSTDTREKYAAYIDSLCRIFSQYGITDAFVQVRPYGDALYKSSVYPTSVYAGVSQGEEPLFDQLEVICEVMGRYSVKVHAWVNPYRVHGSADINELCPANKARQWYRADSNADVAIVGGKIYFNPASERAMQLVVDGARELLMNYPVAGIHIDDYFYPPDCGDFDSAEYNNYLLQGGALSLENWRRSNVNTLVASLYSAVKQCGENRVFSISPAGNINNNRTGLYADVALWSRGGYADMIIPQIYFGFEHETHGFEKCMSDWYTLKGSTVKMPVGLALYKSGTEDSFAGSGRYEWQQSTDIITRQVKHIRDVGGDGFVIFSTEFFLRQSGTAKQELENLKQYLNR